jgi:hypothetical protein
MTFSFHRITKGEVAYLLTTPKTQAWIMSLDEWCKWHANQVGIETQAWSMSLDEWCEWHANQVGIETQALVSAWNAGGVDFMWKYHQAWVHLHRMYVQLYQALIGADATAWDMFDHAKEAEARVDFLCKKWRQSTYLLKMTEALEAVHAKRARARAMTEKFVYA